MVRTGCGVIADITSGAERRVTVRRKLFLRFLPKPDRTRGIFSTLAGAA